MSKTKTIAIKVTTLVRVAPDAERERLSLHFKGESLARLLSMVDNIEAGNFYEAAKTYFQECSHDEREAVGEGMTSVVNGVADRESNKILWTEREPGQCIVETHDGFIDKVMRREQPFSCPLIQPCPASSSSTPFPCSYCLIPPPSVHPPPPYPCMPR